MTLSAALRSPRARWAVPAGVLVVTGLTAGLVPVVAGASSGLPPKTAGQVLADLAGAGADPFAGTVVTTARLGLPALPSTSVAGSASLQSLVSGSHTVRVWYASPTRYRAALVDAFVETDVIRSGDDTWVWTSDSRTAQHLRMPATTAPATPDPASLTPAAAAAQALAAIGPTTSVTVDGSANVAGRQAYELVLSPRDPSSLVGQVRLAVDARTATPLRVQVFPRGANSAAFDTRFTSVGFAEPDAALFRFTPPPGAKVTEMGKDSGAARTELAQPGTGAVHSSVGMPQVVGSGWTSVLVVPGVAVGQPKDATLNTLLRAARPVSGPSWSGRLLTTKLLSVILADDGRLIVGPVTPQVLERVAARP